MAPSLQAAAQLPLVFAFLKRALADDHEAVQAQLWLGLIRVRVRVRVSPTPTPDPNPNPNQVQAQITEAGRVIIEKQPEPEVMVRLLVPMLEAFLAEKAEI